MSLTNRAMHLWKCNGVTDLLKTYPLLRIYPSSYVLLCRIWLFCVKGWRHKYRRTPKIGERWNSALWQIPRYMPLPHMCYHVKFGNSATNGVHIDRKEPQNWKLGSASTPTSWGGSIVEFLKTIRLPICRPITTSSLVVLRQRVYT